MATDAMSNYLIVFDGKAISPNTGTTGLTPAEADAHNKELERREIELMAAAPERLTVYAHLENGVWSARTWLGTTVGPMWVTNSVRWWGWVSSRKYWVRAHIGGAVYHGVTFGEGMYCNLKRVKG